MKKQKRKCWKKENYDQSMVSNGEIFEQNIQLGTKHPIKNE
jgi:hypothetical protein